MVRVRHVGRARTDFGERFGSVPFSLIHSAPLELHPRIFGTKYLKLVWDSLCNSKKKGSTLASPVQNQRHRQ